MKARWLGVVVSLAAVLVLGALLTATLYWTLFDPRWIAFLGGVLFAAMLAAASRASTAEWRLMRRTRQVEDLRAKLALAEQRAHAATEAFLASEERLRLLASDQAAPAADEHDDQRTDDLAVLRASTEKMADWAEPRAKLARALEENQFLLLAQPLAALRPGDAAPVCCEVLLRLKEEEDNLLPPGSFFPVAERYGMMEDLDRWVVRELITRRHEAGRAQAPSHAELYCVNLSRDAVCSPAFARFVQKQLLERGFDGRRLCFEVAEHDIASCHAEVARLISMLKPLGCRFTVDAFGSVKGCFSALKGLAFDFVKIDGVIIQNMRRHPAELAKVRAIVNVCRQAGMRTIAEFVEDAETLAALRAVGVDYAQGFGVARPAPLHDAPALAVAA
jgi:EAL domain-containing protein (putative c-di-GMP-specific phosphodiesterase class I)